MDFIEVDEKKQILPSEIKYKKEVNQADLKNLLLFMKKCQVNTGQVYYLGIEKKIIQNNGKTILLLPPWG